MRITAQLIDGRRGDHVWADRYDRDLTDIFAIQDEISKAIVDALKVKLLPEEKKAIENRGTTNPEAYNLYLMARQLWVTGTHGDRRREEMVIRICRRGYRTRAGLRPGLGAHGACPSLSPFGYNEGATTASKRPIGPSKLDPSLAEAYCVKARAAAEHGATSPRRRRRSTSALGSIRILGSAITKPRDLSWQHKYR